MGHGGVEGNGHAHRKIRKTESGPCLSPDGIPLGNWHCVRQSLGSEVMRDLPPDHGNISELDERDADMDGFASSDTPSTCCNYYSSA